VAGLVRPASGQISLDGRPVGGMTTHRLVRLGVSLAPEGRQVFSRFTVDENLAGGAYSRRGVAAVAGDRARLFALSDPGGATATARRHAVRRRA